MRCVVYWAASEVRIASPSAPPIWRDVLTRPEARPALLRGALAVAAIVEGTTDKPDAQRGEQTGDQQVGGAAVDRDRREQRHPAAMTASPEPRTGPGAEAADEAPGARGDRP